MDDSNQQQSENCKCGAAATHLLLGLNTRRVCRKCYAAAMEVLGPPKEPQYYIGEQDGTLHRVSYDAWRRCGN